MPLQDPLQLGHDDSLVASGHNSASLDGDCLCISADKFVLKDIHVIIMPLSFIE